MLGIVVGALAFAAGVLLCAVCGPVTALYFLVAACAGAIGVHSWRQDVAWRNRASTPKLAPFAAEVSRFNNYSVYLNGRKCGCMTVAKLKMDHGGSELELRQVVPTEHRVEQQHLLESYKKQERVQLQCGVIGGAIFTFKEMTVTELRYETDARGGQVTMVALLKSPWEQAPDIIGHEGTDAEDATRIAPEQLHAV